MSVNHAGPSSEPDMKAVTGEQVMTRLTSYFPDGQLLSA